MELTPLSEETLRKRAEKLASLSVQEIERGEYFSAFDIESTEWEKFQMAGVFDGSCFRAYRSMEDALKGLFEVGYSHRVFSHFGGGFDFLFVLAEVFEREHYRVTNMIPRGEGGSTILCFDVESVRYPGIKLTFVDSIAFLPFSLAKLCEDFKTKHQKTKIDVENFDVNNHEHIAYNENDCRALYECIDSFRKSPLISKVGMRITTASQSMTILRTFLDSPIKSLVKPASKDYLDMTDRERVGVFRDDIYIRGSDTYNVLSQGPGVRGETRPAYFGGRTEVFTPWFEGPPQMYCYDINSMYPAVMRDEEFPHQVQSIEVAGKHRIKFDERQMGFWDVTVEVPEMFIPPLGVLYKMAHANKYIFPTGVFRGKFATPELVYALSVGCKIHRVHSVMRMTSAGRIFEKFVRFLYELRKNALTDVDKVIAKLLLNSCYGRFGLDLRRTELGFDVCAEGSVPTDLVVKLDNGEEVFLAENPKMLKGFSHVGIAAYVTAYARTKLHRFLSVDPEAVYYCDTDSLFTTRVHPTSGELGDLKEEYRIQRAAFIMPKAYSVEVGEAENLGNPEKVVTKIKGLDKRKLGRFSPAALLDALRGSYEIERMKQRGASKAEVEKVRSTQARVATKIADAKDDSKGVGLMRFKTAMRKANRFVARNTPLTRELRSLYDKRRLYVGADGSFRTEPYVLREGRIINEGDGDCSRNAEG